MVGAAIEREGRILAAQRSQEMPLPGKWEFPGGKVEPGETHQQALVREIEEELGLQIAVGAYLGVGTAPASRGRTVRLHVYLATLLGGQLELDEHARIGWFDAASLEGLDWAEADIPVIPAAVARLRRERAIDAR